VVERDVGSVEGDDAAADGEALDGGGRAGGGVCGLRPGRRRLRRWPAACEREDGDEYEEMTMAAHERDPPAMMILALAGRRRVWAGEGEAGWDETKEEAGTEEVCCREVRRG